MIVTRVFFILLLTSGQKRRRPEVSSISETMISIFDLIETSEEYQFSITHLIEELDIYKPDVKTVSEINRKVWQ